MLLCFRLELSDLRSDSLKLVLCAAGAGSRRKRSCEGEEDGRGQLPESDAERAHTSNEVWGRTAAYLHALVSLIDLLVAVESEWDATRGVMVSSCPRTGRGGDVSSTASTGRSHLSLGAAAFLESADLGAAAADMVEQRGWNVGEGERLWVC